MTYCIGAPISVQLFPGFAVVMITHFQCSVILFVMLQGVRLSISKSLRQDCHENAPLETVRSLCSNHGFTWNVNAHSNMFWKEQHQWIPLILLDEETVGWSVHLPFWASVSPTQHDFALSRDFQTENANVAPLECILVVTKVNNTKRMSVMSQENGFGRRSRSLFGWKTMIRKGNSVIIKKQAFYSVIEEQDHRCMVKDYDLVPVLRRQREPAKRGNTDIGEWGTPWLRVFG